VKSEAQSEFLGATRQSKADLHVQGAASRQENLASLGAIVIGIVGGLVIAGNSRPSSYCPTSSDETKPGFVGEEFHSGKCSFTADISARPS